MIQNSSMLVDLNISTWTGRKMDKKVSEEIDASKNTRVKAGNYSKKLLAGAEKLDTIQKLVASMRIWHYAQTLPWADGGARLLPMANFFTYKDTLNKYEEQFNDAVEDFLCEYPTLVSAAAFQLGDLFDKDEYPDALSLASKFKFRYVFLPVPEAGDFRIDINEESRAVLKEQYEKYYDDKLNAAMQDAWDRLHACVKHLSDKLADAETPRKDKDGNENRTQIFRDTLVSNAVDMCSLLTKLNVTGDTNLERARRQLEESLYNVTPAVLRDSDEVRKNTKAKIDDILSMF